MLSRVADSLYWTSRHLARVENTARLVSVNSYLTLDLPSEVGHWEPLVEAMGASESFHSRYDKVDSDNVVRFLTYDFDNPDSILCSINAARSNAHSARDFITLEMWEELNSLYLQNAGCHGGEPDVAGVLQGHYPFLPVDRRHHRRHHVS